MLTKSVTKAALTANVARLTLADVIGLEIGAHVRIAGIGNPFDGNHFLTAVDTDDSWVQYAQNHANVTEATVTGLLEVFVSWAAVEDVEAFLGVEPASQSDEDYLALCVDAANEWAYERRRKSGYSDLYNAVPGQDVKLGTVLYAGALYRERGSLESFASFQDMPTIAPIGTMGQILRLLGCNRPRVH